MYCNILDEIVPQANYMLRVSHLLEYQELGRCVLLDPTPSHSIRYNRCA